MIFKETKMNRLSALVRPFSRTALRPVINTPARWFSNAQTFLDRNEVADRVKSVLTNFDKVNAASITEQAKFIEDLKLDSLDVVEVVMAMEEEFVIEIPDSEAEKLMTPGQVIDFVASHPMAK